MSAVIAYLAASRAAAAPPAPLAPEDRCETSATVLAERIGSQYLSLAAAEANRNIRWIN